MQCLPGLRCQPPAGLRSNDARVHYPVLPLESRLCRCMTKIASWHRRHGRSSADMECMRLHTEDTLVACTCIAFSPDGERLVSDSFDNTVGYGMSIWGSSAGHDGPYKLCSVDHVLEGWKPIAPTRRIRASLSGTRQPVCKSAGMTELVWVDMLHSQRTIYV